MPKSWDSLAESCNREIAEFQSAAGRLFAEQVLYETDPAQRAAYLLIAQQPAAFREVFEGLFGMSLVLDPDYRFCAVVPRLERQPSVSLAVTLLMLVLLKLHHQAATEGDLDQGAATVAIDDLRSMYQDLLGRELPVKDIPALLAAARRYGAVRVVEDADAEQPYAVRILPGIRAVLSEATLERLAGFAAKAGEPAAPETESLAESAGATE